MNHNGEGGGGLKPIETIHERGYCEWFLKKNWKWIFDTVNCDQTLRE